jgi:hypothetical protein
VNKFYACNPGFRANGVKARSSLGRPITGLPPVGRRMGFKAWATDERLGTFILTRGEEPPMRDDLCHLTILDATDKDNVGDTNTEREVIKPQAWYLPFPILESPPWFLIWSPRVSER